MGNRSMFSPCGLASMRAIGTPFSPTFTLQGVVVPFASFKLCDHVVVSSPGGTCIQYTFAHESMPIPSLGKLPCAAPFLVELALKDLAVASGTEGLVAPRFD